MYLYTFCDGDDNLLSQTQNWKLRVIGMSSSVSREKLELSWSLFVVRQREKKRSAEIHCVESLARMRLMTTVRRLENRQKELDLYVARLFRVAFRYLFARLLWLTPVLFGLSM